MTHFTPRQLYTYLLESSSPPLLLDVREPWEYDIARIDGSRLIPMGQILVGMHQLRADEETVVICHHGIRSRQIAMLLERNGFTRVINLTGGVNSWARDVDLDMATY